MNSLLATVGDMLAKLRRTRVRQKSKRNTVVETKANTQPDAAVDVKVEDTPKPPIADESLPTKAIHTNEHDDHNHVPPHFPVSEPLAAAAHSLPADDEPLPAAHTAVEDDLESSKLHAADAALDSNVGEVRVYYDPQGVYLLPADDGELSRLTLQHHLITIHMDHKLILPPLEWADGDEVLDSGTGTGSWTLDAQPQLPSFVKFTGVDISPRLFPAPLNTPPNVSFVQGSSTALPAEWTNWFTLINQRMLLGGFTKQMWPDALSEFFRVLKPGGWAQLTEATMHHGGAATARHISIMQAMFTARGLDIDIAQPGRLTALFTQAGFVNVTEVRRPAQLGSWAGELGALGRRNVVAGYRAMKAPIVASGLSAPGGVYTEAEYEQLMDDMAHELDVTEGSGMEWVCVYGQKPTA